MLKVYFKVYGIIHYRSNCEVLLCEHFIFANFVISIFGISLISIYVTISSNFIKISDGLYLD